jgi:hypothetical protein
MKNFIKFIKEASNDGRSPEDKRMGILRKSASKENEVLFKAVSDMYDNIKSVKLSGNKEARGPLSKISSLKDKAKDRFLSDVNAPTAMNKWKKELLSLLKSEVSFLKTVMKAKDIKELMRRLK